MKLRSITLLALLCALSNCVSANIGLPTLEELLNAFIATYAKESRYLKKSVTSITHIGLHARFSSKYSVSSHTP